MKSHEKASAPNASPRWWRRPGAAGVILALVSVPLILLLGQAGVLVALAALCLYPILDVPRILGCRSWWLGALVSAAVWFVLFVMLAATADRAHRLGEGAMVFLLPFMMYPVALGVSGLVRLEGRLRGRPPESGPRIAAIACTIASGSFVVVPLTLNVIPAITQKVTGNTPPNWIETAEGEVLSAAAGQVSVRTALRTEPFALGPGTRFAFRGPGSATVKGTPSPEWLKPGQRVALEYIRRGGQAQARSVDIWIERRGCAGDPKWAAANGAPAAAARPGGSSLAGTTWEGWIGSPEKAEPANRTSFHFLEGSRLAYGGPGNVQHTDGAWRQDGAAVIVEVGDCYALYAGRIEGNEIKGEYSNEVGGRASWTARRLAPEVR